MMMMLLRSSLLLSLALKATSGFEFGLTNPFHQKDFACSVEGAAGQDVCDASKATDGSQCVWCSVQSFGVCVSEDQAEAMKKAIPGLDCDDDDNNDDDNTPSDDDAPPADDDDVTPDNYWKCLKGYSEKEDCTGAGCEWCSNKAGYGICIDPTSAAKIDKYDWFDCTTVLDLDLSYFGEEDIDEDAFVSDPYDPTCLQASLSGDAATCQATNDMDGNPCEWCSVASNNLCLSGEQAQVIEMFGGDCSSLVAEAEVKDPYDTSCLLATLANDESTCESTVDEDGNVCEWCNVNSMNLCLNAEQSEIVQQIGGTCSSPNADDDATPTDDDDNITPDRHWECLKGFTDQDGCTEAGCQWCSNKAGYGVCLDPESATKIDMYDWFVCTTVLDLDLSFFEAEEDDALVSDPYDPTCLQASLSGDAATCQATIDMDGNPCEWCTVASSSLCLSGEQAEILEQFGGDCSTIAEVEELDAVTDPYDTSCLMATLENDESACESTVDEEGNGCEWCIVNSMNLCLNAEQAQIAEQIGGSCNSMNAPSA